MSPRSTAAEEHAFEEELAPSEQTDYIGLADLDDVRMQVSAELGTCRLHVREILELQRGSVLPLDKLAGEMADVRVNGILIGRGEIVVIGDTINVRIADIFGLAGSETEHED
jgi:flagellar motor switch protein FliN/FliY